MSTGTLSFLHPIDLDEFLATYWEKQTLHISRKDVSYFSDQLNLQSIVSHLPVKQRRFPKIQLTMANKPLNSAEYVNGNNVIDIDKLHQLRNQGATLVWAQAQDDFNSLNQLCLDAQQRFHLHSQTNVYVSPPAQQGFNAHYDSHDVFILQTEGKKSFRIYDQGVFLPFANEKFDSEVHQPGALLETIELTAGDTLYIPRGVMHDAVASDDEISVHITLGVYAQTYRDLLHRVIETSSDENQILRQSLPASVWASQRADTDTVEHIRELLVSSVSQGTTATSLSELRDEVAIQSATIIESANDKVPAEIIVDEQTRIGCRRHAILCAQRDGRLFKIRCHGRVLSFDEPFAAAVELFLEHFEGSGTKPLQFFVGDFFGLAPEQSIALAKQMLDENVAEICTIDS